MIGTTDYSGRLVDLCFMPGVDVTRTAQQKVNMTLDEEHGGYICAGHMKLAQRVLIGLFSSRYKVNQYPTQSLLSLIKGSSINQVRRQFEQSFVDAASQVMSFLTSYETADDPPDERLLSVTLASWNVDVATGLLTASIRIQTRDLIRPEILVPITISIARVNR